MIETELNNQNRCHILKKDNIDNVRSKVNNKLKKLKESGLISEKSYKDLKPHTPKTPSARPLLKIHKNPLKLDLSSTHKTLQHIKQVNFRQKNYDKSQHQEKVLSKIQKVLQKT